MAACDSTGARKRLCFDTALPFDASSLWFEFLSESMTKNDTLAQTGGVTGSRNRHINQSRQGTQAPGGSIVLVANRILLDALLPHILGGSESADVFNFAETLPEFYIGIEKGVGFYTYNECMVSFAEFRKGANDFIELELGIEAESETGPTGSFPAITARDWSAPYHFIDITDGVTVEGTERDCKDFSVRIDNAPVTDDFVGLTRNETLCPQDLKVTGFFEFDANSDHNDLPGAGNDQNVATIVATHAEEASSVLTISLANLVWPDITPQVPGRSIFNLRLDWESLGDDTDSAIAITNAHA